MFMVGLVQGFRTSRTLRLSMSTFPRAPAGRTSWRDRDLSSLLSAARLLPLPSSRQLLGLYRALGSAGTRDLSRSQLRPSKKCPIRHFVPYQKTQLHLNRLKTPGPGLSDQGVETSRTASFAPTHERMQDGLIIRLHQSRATMFLYCPLMPFSCLSKQSEAAFVFLFSDK